MKRLADYSDSFQRECKNWSVNTKHDRTFAILMIAKMSEEDHNIFMSNKKQREQDLKDFWLDQNRK